MPGLLLQGYYAILDVQGEAPPASDELISRAEELLAARPCCLQLRGKRLAAGALAAAAALVRPMCGAAGVLFCVNDRVDVALAVGADLVHVGQDDLPLAETRRIAGGRLRVGVSTHTPAQARSAVAEGADYIGFGPIFSTRSKDRPDPVVGLEGLRAVADAVGDAVPVVAIGGIELDSVGLVASAGARAAAVISAVDRARDRTAAGRRVAAAFLPA
jgi:thiamine-phosphate pyrophosphorylase